MNRIWHLSCGQRTLGGLAVLALAIAVTAQAPTTDEAKTSPAATLGPAPTIALFTDLGADVQAYSQHLITLANPWFEGRAPGTNGNRLAADYIEHQFRLLNLVPAFAETEVAADGTEVITPNATFRQFVPSGSVIGVTSASLKAAPARGAEVTFRKNIDFAVMPQSATGEASGPIAFVGYSIEDGRDGYSNYPDETDLTGKIAMMFRFEPMDDKGQSLWAPGRWSEFANIDDKIRSAARRGAAGIIMVNPPGADDPRAKQLLNVDGARGGMRGVPVPTIMINADVADRLVRTADAQGRSIQDLRAHADSTNGWFELTNAQVSMSATIERVAIQTDNVGAMLPGRGAMADQVVIIGAHYDHIGYGDFGSRSPNRRGEVHPGADDNASGTSGLLYVAGKIARAYAEMPDDADARSVLFLAFTSEESGLIGSRHFVQNPSIPLESIYFMLNLDMIGKLSNNQFEVSGIGTAEGLADWVRPYFDASGLSITSKPGGTGPSDHASFYRARIPVMFFFTGLHDDYHAASDEWWKVDMVGAVKVAELCREIAMGLATRPEPFPYLGSQRPAPQAQAPAQEEAPQAAGPRGLRVRFGVMPGDYTGSDKGVVVGDVFENTSAAEAGLKKGDRITKWNGQLVESVEAWMPMLANHNPGDVVEVTFMRDGREIRTHAILKAAESGNR